MLLIGDVHGQVAQYYRLLQKHIPDYSIQLGDFGFQRQHQWFLANMNTDRHRVLFGNHDYYPYLEKPHSLQNTHIDPERRLMSIRGAYSIDQSQRVEGRDWWGCEELNYAEMRSAVDAYWLFRPDIMLSHDCPHEVRKALFGITEKSSTSNGLQACFEIHQPRLLIFGHHHRSRSEVINGTRFVCLAELETLEI